MKKTSSTTLVIAAALAGLTAMASAQTYGNPNPTWHQGGSDPVSVAPRDAGNWREGDGNDRYRNQSRSIMGTWRMVSRSGDVSGGRGRGWRQPRGWANNMQFALPNMINIERYRRDLQVTGPNGQQLRSIDAGRGYGQSGPFVSTGRFGGATYKEFYSLQNHGRQLVIRTVVSGNRDSREFTTVYQRS